MTEYKCGDCFHADLCEESETLVGFNRDNPAYCGMFLNSADVAPVRHGRWIKESDGGTRCSVCNKRVRDVTGGGDEPVDLSYMPYCPKCGAKMDGDTYD